MCAYDDSDGPIVHRDTRPVARKPHQCIECRRMIEPGEEYERATALYDGGGWQDFVTCRHCVVARGWLRTICNGWLYHGVFDELCDHWHEGYESLWLGRAIVGMRRGWSGLDPLPEFECDHRYGPRWGSTRCACGVSLEAAA